MVNVKMTKLQKDNENKLTKLNKRIIMKTRNMLWNFVKTVIKIMDYRGENIIYEKLLSDKLSVNLGYIYENVVAQILSTNGNALYYYTFLNDKTNHNYEIDFLLSKKNKICPIEVKSSGYNTHKSLDVFLEKFSERILEKYVVHTKDLKKDRDILMLPVYILPFI